MENLKQYVPSLVCLSCEVCCRFTAASSRWRPRVGEGERGELSDEYPLGKMGVSSIEADGYLQTEMQKDSCRCIFFNLQDNVCAVYERRPFECCLYPFLLVRDEGRLRVAAHLACPFIERLLLSPFLQEYAAYLKDYLETADGKNFLRENPVLFGDYSADRGQLQFLFDLSAD